jgi:hypothetical protein
VTDSRRNAGASVRARLKNEARAKGTPFQSQLERYALQQWLFRLQLIPERANSYVLKGGFLMHAFVGDAARRTRDLDLLSTIQTSQRELVRMAHLACSIECNSES